MSGKKGCSRPDCLALGNPACLCLLTQSLGSSRPRERYENEKDGETDCRHDAIAHYPRSGGSALALGTLELPEVS